MATPNTQTDILVAQVESPAPSADSKADIVTRTRSALAMGLLALSISGAAVAQDKVNATQSPTAVVAVDNSPTTKDGRQFAKLTEAEVDALSDAEFDQYNKWKITLKVARGIELDKSITSKQLELGLKASQAIQPLLAEYKAGKKPVISPELKDTLIKIAKGELPPPNMRVLAQELVTYFA